jgi:hypothetical protein
MLRKSLMKKFWLPEDQQRIFEWVIPFEYTMVRTYKIVRYTAHDLIFTDMFYLHGGIRFSATSKSGQFKFFEVAVPFAFTRPLCPDSNPAVDRK